MGERAARARESERARERVGERARAREGEREREQKARSSWSSPLPARLGRGHECLSYIVDDLLKTNIPFASRQPFRIDHAPRMPTNRSCTFPVLSFSSLSLILSRSHPCPSPSQSPLNRNLACQWLGRRDEYLIAASIHDKYSVGPSIRPICTRSCFTMTNMIQVCSNFR